MQRADMSAYPQDENGHSQNGMTIRERFVMAAMQGLLANSDPTVWMNDGGLLSSAAISIADATLAALEQSDG